MSSPDFILVQAISLWKEAAPTLQCLEAGQCGSLTRKLNEGTPEPMLFRKGLDCPFHCWISWVCGRSRVDILCILFFGNFCSSFGLGKILSTWLFLQHLIYTPQSEFLRWPELGSLKLSPTLLKGQLNSDWKFYNVCVSFCMLSSI